jgi:hypothetical protein
MIALSLPVSVSAQTTATSILIELTKAFTTFVALGWAVALAVFMWGVVTFIAKSGDDKEIVAGRKRMVWGVIGMFLLLTVWGVVYILSVIFGFEPITTCTPPFIVGGDTPGVQTCF